MKPSAAINKLLQEATVLVVDDNVFMRSLIRGLLTHIGVKSVHEAADGVIGLSMIPSLAPSMVFVDWEMPLLNGAEFVRLVRSPGSFPFPEVPLIMVTGHAEHWRVKQAMQLGVNDFLVKPLSANVMLQHMLGILANPRPMVRMGSYYGPKPRQQREDRPFAVPMGPSVFDLPADLAVS